MNTTSLYNKTAPIDRVSIYDESLHTQAIELKSALESFPIKLLSEITIRSPNWLGEKFLEEGTFGMLIGESGAGKSFISIDFALSVATGTPWHDLSVVQGPVLYIASEGRSGVLRRVYGWAKTHLTDPASIPFCIPDNPIDLNDKARMRIVRNAVDAITEKAGPLKLIIVDTWAASIGGDENSTLDTMAGLSALKSLAKPYGSAVLIVHHVGHNDKNRGRGSSSLHAAMDIVHRVEKGKNGLIHVINSKAKDTEPSSPMCFLLKPVELEIENDKGKLETTAVLEAKYFDSEPAPKEVTGKRQRIAMGCLIALTNALEKAGIDHDKIRVSLDEWRNAFLEKFGQAGARAFSQTKKTLVDEGRVIEEEGYFYPQ